MQFEVNGQHYFLQFSPEDGELCLLRPGRDGVERMAISDDSDLMNETLVPFDTDSPTTVN